MAAPKVNTITASVGQVQLMGLDVLNWRYEQLEDAGYPVDIAVKLAEIGTVDLHLACRLLANGATPQEAVRILT